VPNCFEAAEERYFLLLRAAQSVPQRLKPRRDQSSYGPTKVVPDTKQFGMRFLGRFFSPDYLFVDILRMVLVVLMPLTVGTISTRPPQVVISSAPTMVAVV
jgi:hypothetical protein